MHKSKNILIVYFFPYVRSFSFRKYKFIPFGWVSDNCFIKSENSTLKIDAVGPKHNHKLHNSAVAINKHMDRHHWDNYTYLIKQRTTRIHNSPHDEDMLTVRIYLSTIVLIIRLTLEVLNGSSGISTSTCLQRIKTMFNSSMFEGLQSVKLPHHCQTKKSFCQ